MFVVRAKQSKPQGNHGPSPLKQTLSPEDISIHEDDDKSNGGASSNRGHDGSATGPNENGSDDGSSSSGDKDREHNNDGSGEKRIQEEKLLFPCPICKLRLRIAWLDTSNRLRESNEIIAILPPANKGAHYMLTVYDKVKPEIMQMEKTGPKLTMPCEVNFGCVVALCPKCSDEWFGREIHKLFEKAEKMDRRGRTYVPRWYWTSKACRSSRELPGKIAQILENVEEHARLATQLAENKERGKGHLLLDSIREPLIDRPQRAGRKKYHLESMRKVIHRLKKGYLGKRNLQKDNEVRQAAEQKRPIETFLSATQPDNICGPRGKDFKTMNMLQRWVYSYSADDPSHVIRDGPDDEAPI